MLGKGAGYDQDSKQTSSSFQHVRAVVSRYTLVHHSCHQNFVRVFLFSYVMRMQKNGNELKRTSFSSSIAGMIAH